MRFLDTIVKEKREEVRARSARTSLETLEARGRELNVRDFGAALVGSGTRLIAELKARTPTIEQFAATGSLDRLAPTYESNGACAISVVVDEKRFGTSLAFVERIRATVSLPVLVKEFVVDAYQVVEARAYGADAVLLIARVLEGSDLAAFIRLAHHMGMAALVETHDEADVRRAVEAGARIIGINNRDLDRMSVSLDTSRRLLPLVPANCTRVIESGIASREHIDDLTRLGADAFLVGGAILSAADPGAKVRELVGRNVEESP